MKMSDDKRDEEFEKIRGEACAAAAASAAPRRLKKGEEYIDNINLDQADPNAKDEYGYPVIPLPRTADNMSQGMFARIRRHGALEPAYEKAMLEDESVSARKEVLREKKKAQDSKLGKADDEEILDEVEKAIIEKPAMEKR